MPTNIVNTGFDGVVFFYLRGENCILAGRKLHTCGEKIAYLRGENCILAGRKLHTCGEVLTYHGKYDKVIHKHL